jgi:hypothetical protein
MKRDDVARISLSHFDVHGKRVEVIAPHDIEIGMILFTASGNSGHCSPRTRLLVFQVTPTLSRTLRYYGNEIFDIWGIGHHWYDASPEEWTYHTHEDVHN